MDTTAPFTGYLAASTISISITEEFHPIDFRRNNEGKTVRIMSGEGMGKEGVFYYRYRSGDVGVKWNDGTTSKVARWRLVIVTRPEVAEEPVTPTAEDVAVVAPLAATLEAIASEPAVATDNDFKSDMPSYLSEVAIGGIFKLRHITVEDALAKAEEVVAGWVAQGSPESQAMTEIKRWIERHKPVEDANIALPEHLAQDFANAPRLNMHNVHAVELAKLGLLNWYGGTWSRPSSWMYTMQGQYTKARMGL